MSIHTKILPYFIATTLYIGCGDKEHDSTTDTTHTDEPSGEPADDTSPPQAPSPFSITISGTDNETLMFDSPTCQIPDAASNINLFWRLASGAHKFVFRIMVRDDYQGTGTYNNTDHNLKVSLQEEAGGQARFYQADTTMGDSATLTLETDEDGYVWGTIEIASMHNGADAITLSPTSFPIWCEASNTN